MVHAPRSATMEQQPRAVPSLSPAESEAFWRTGQDARAAASGEEPETIQNDAESATTGAVAASQRCADAPHAGSPTTLRGREYVAGEVPLPLRDCVGDVHFDAELRQLGFNKLVDEIQCRNDLRDALLVKLIWASLHLAEKRIAPYSLCRDCGVYNGHIWRCETGAVLRILAELRATVEPDGPGEVIHPDKKEAAASEGKDCAGDSGRPRGVTVTETPYDWVTELHCAQCRQTGGEGWSLISQQSHCKRALKDNESALQQGGWVYVYEHNCAVSKGAASSLVPQRDYLCIACGVSDRNWTGLKRPAKSVLVADLRDDQCVSAPLNGESGHIEWTHRCQKGGAQ